MDDELARRFWEDAPDAAIAIGGDGKVVFWNRAAETIFGYSSLEAKDHTLAELLLPETSGEPEVEPQPRSDRGTDVYEAVRKRKDGTLVYVNASSKIIRSDADNVDYVLYTKKDVTALRIGRDAQLLKARYGALPSRSPTQSDVLSWSTAKQTSCSATPATSSSANQSRYFCPTVCAERTMHTAPPMSSNPVPAPWDAVWPCPGSKVMARNSPSRSA
jgi:PAS domain S-box-containing protein